MDRDDGPPTQGLPIASPANMLPVQVIRREVAAPDAVTFHIVLPGTQQAPAPYLPGQFVTLALPTPRETLYRSYSLCGPGTPNMPWEITVKKMHMGAVSTYFYNMVNDGSMLYSSVPRGSFTLPSRLPPKSPLVFIAAGSGITPLFGMLRSLALLPPDERPRVQLHYAAKSLEMMIYERQLAEIDPYDTWLTQWYYLSSEREHMTADAIMTEVGDRARFAHWYMCGPEPLKRDLIAELEDLHVRPEQIHTEVFAVQQSPAYHLAGSPTTASTIHIATTNATLEIEPRETILAALERQGYHPDFSCRIGMCGACKLRVTKGQALPAGEALSSAERQAGYVLSCIAVPTGDITLENGGKPPTGSGSVGAGAAGGSSRSEATIFARLTTVLALSGLLLGTWNLTNHKPMSWSVYAAPSPTDSSTPAPGDTSGTPIPGATSNPQSGVPTTAPGVATYTPRPSVPTVLPGAPTYTPQPVAPTVPPGQKSPTATPAPAGAPTPTAVPATPKPIPTPKATSTPSPKH